MPITASTGQQQGLPIVQGTTNLALVSGSQPSNVTQAAPTGPGINITSQLLGFTLVPTGTLDDVAVVEVQAQINGSAFLPIFTGAGSTKLSWTGAQIKAGSGLYYQLAVKANQIRFVLSSQTTIGGGVITRVMD